MSDAERAFESAMTDYLRDSDLLDEGEFITHYVLVYATTNMSGENDVRLLTSGPSEDQGIPPWQARGLLTEGVRKSFLLDTSVDDDV